VKVDRPNAPVWETSQVIGQMWRDLTDKEKGVYVAEYEADKVSYNMIDRLCMHHLVWWATCNLFVRPVSEWLN